MEAADWGEIPRPQTAGGISLRSAARGRRECFERIKWIKRTNFCAHCRGLLLPFAAHLVELRNGESMSTIAFCGFLELRA
jgi:hypothetical protein